MLGSAKALSRRSELFRLSRAKAAVLGTSFLLLACGFIPVARADTPAFPTEPILRPNPEFHTARIGSISVDKHGQFVATGSEDTTVTYGRQTWFNAAGDLAGLEALYLTHTACARTASDRAHSARYVRYTLRSVHFEMTVTLGGVDVFAIQVW